MKRLSNRIYSATKYLSLYLFFFLTITFSLSINSANTSSNSVAIGMLSNELKNEKDNIWVLNFYSDSSSLQAGSVVFYLAQNPRNSYDFTLTSITLTDNLVGEPSEDKEDPSSQGNISYNYRAQISDSKSVLYRYNLTQLQYKNESFTYIAWVIPPQKAFSDTFNEFKIINNTTVEFKEGAQYLLCYTAEGILTQLIPNNSVLKYFYYYLEMDIETSCKENDNPQVDYQ